MNFEWENGRILKKINTSDKSVQMSYDSNGMRTQKTVDGVKTNYYYDSNKNLIALVKGNDTLLFYYDSDGSATSFSYNGTMYFYVKNLQGDVIRIIDLIPEIKLIIVRVINLISMKFYTKPIMLQ